MSFHVPNQYRVKDDPVLGSDDSYGNNGYFRLRSSVTDYRLDVIASDGEGWEHVSVVAHLKGSERGNRLGKKITRTPFWNEMCQVKDIFWDAEDTVVQYHPSYKDYINLHPHVLHLWRPTNPTLMPLPPSWMVGPKDFKLKVLESLIKEDKRG